MPERLRNIPKSLKLSTVLSLVIAAFAVPVRADIRNVLAPLPDQQREISGIGGNDPTRQIAPPVYTQDPSGGIWRPDDLSETDQFKAPESQGLRVYLEFVLTENSKIQLLKISLSVNNDFNFLEIEDYDCVISGDGKADFRTIPEEFKDFKAEDAIKYLVKIAERYVKERARDGNPLLAQKYYWEVVFK